MASVVSVPDARRLFILTFKAMGFKYDEVLEGYTVKVTDENIDLVQEFYEIYQKIYGLKRRLPVQPGFTFTIMGMDEEDWQEEIGGK